MSSEDGRPSGDRPAVERPAPRQIGCAWPLAAALVGVIVLVAVTLGLAVGRYTAPAPASSVTVVRAGPSVVTAVRDLARLESAEFHMERVIDLRSKQEKLFGLIESEDAILLVAAARVSAGVDLSKLREEDVEVDHDQKRVVITLPPAEVFDATLDNSRTYVHSRDTDLLADREQNLETKARQAAEKELVESAKQAGLLGRASTNAQKTVEQLVRSLGFTDVTVRVRD